jgi:peptide/nickel transport system permease protein
MDVFSRVISAPRTDLSIALIATSLAVLIGSPLGVISGYSRGALGEVIARGLDIVQTFPPFILAMAAVAMAGQDIRNVIVVLAATNAPMFARLLRTRVYALQEARFIEAATAVGNSEPRIIFYHLLPNAWQIVFIQFSVNVGWAILLTAGLSFIGAGVRVPTPEWGSMIAIGAPNIVTGEWWVALFPGLALGITVLGFAILGNAFEVLLDPTRSE